jgi:excisionase family DNA binding protein
MQRSERPLTDQPTQRPSLVEPVTEEPTVSPFMPAKDAAALMGVSADHVNRAVRAGAIPGYKWGAVYRVLRAFVDAVYAEICAGNGVVIEEYAAAWKSRRAVA